MFKHEYDQIIRENFDLSDDNTRRYIIALEDAGQDQLLNALSSAMYDSIVSKVDEIDFGTIPMSRGDITKVEGFAGTEQSLSIMRQLVLQYKQSTSIVDVVITAIQNIKDRKHLFIKGYALNNELTMLMYNLMVLSVERSVSLMLATCIQFAKDPSSSTPKQALDKVAYQRTMDDVMFKQLITFNNLCKNNQFDKALEASMKNMVKEDVEIQYAADVETPVNDSPVGMYDPFGSEEAPSAEPAPEVDEIPAGDPEAQAAVELPDGEDPASAPNGVQVDDPQGDPMDGARGEEVPAATEPEKDEVEPDNIPAVVPGEEISSTDAPISEGDPVDTSTPVVDPTGADGSEVEEGASDAIKGAGALAVNVAKVLVGNGATLDPKAAADAAKAISRAKTIAKIGTGALVVLKGIPFLVTKVMIPMIRDCVYGFYYTKMKFSDYLAVQADTIEANANELEVSTTSDLDDNQRKKVADKQRKAAEKLRKWSNAFNIDKTSTKKSVDSAVKEDEKNKRKIAKDADGDDALF